MGAGTTTLRIEVEGYPGADAEELDEATRALREDLLVLAQIVQ